MLLIHLVSKKKILFEQLFEMLQSDACQALYCHYSDYYNNESTINYY
jgi:hypothetical protein